MTIDIKSHLREDGTQQSQAHRERLEKIKQRRFKNVKAVDYLVFSGGGGRAIAHLGALAALADLGYFIEVEKQPLGLTPRYDYVPDPEVTKGLAGASAGAIIASLLATDHGVREIFNTLQDPEIMDKFFQRERFDVSYRPTITGCERLLPRDPNEDLWGSGRGRSPTLGPYFDLLLDTAGVPDKQKAKFRRDPSAATQLLDLSSSTVGGSIYTAIEMFFDVSRDEVSDTMDKRLFRENNVSAYLRNLLAEYGLFSGCEIRDWLVEALDEFATVRGSLGTGSVIGSTVGPKERVTFDYLKKRTQLDLVIMGSNLTTGDSRAFRASDSDTANVPIADAVRLSMAFPFVYKPTVVNNKNHPLYGLWTDGGLYNNYPLHVFDVPGKSINRSVLGFLLDDEIDPTVSSLGSYGELVARRLVNLNTSCQIRTISGEAQTVIVPTKGLSLLDFTPNRSTVREAVTASAKGVYRYFNHDESVAEALAKSAVNDILYDTIPTAQRDRPSTTTPKKKDPVEAAHNRARQKFNREMQSLIKQAADHPLSFLIDPSSGGWWSASRYAETVTVNAGHLRSQKVATVGTNHLALEDASFNLTFDQPTEHRSVEGYFEKTAILIDDVPVDLRTAQMWSSTGKLKGIAVPGTTKTYPVRPEWTDGWKYTVDSGGNLHVDGIS